MFHYISFYRHVHVGDVSQDILMTSGLLMYRCQHLCGLLFLPLASSLRPELVKAWYIGTDPSTSLVASASQVIAAKYTSNLFPIVNIQHSGYLGDLWRFDLQNSTWSLVESRGASPWRRYGHSLVEIYGNLYVFGGDSDLGDTHVDCQCLAME